MGARDDTSTACAPAAGRPAGWRRGTLLALLLLLGRIPFWNHPAPLHPDEEAFVAGIGFPADYPVHPPGYPLWVALGTALSGAGLEPYAAYQVWSLLASVAGPLLLYLGLRRIVADGLAWWLALALGVNPLVWFQSTGALTYGGACVVGLIVAGLCHRAVTEPGATGLRWGAVVLGAGLFLRPDLLIYAGPMFAHAAWRSRRRGGYSAMLIVVAAGAAFYAVMLLLYARQDPAAAGARLAHTRDVVLGTSVFRLGLVDGLLRNLAKIGLNLGWDLGAGSVLLVPAGWVVFRARRAQAALARLIALWLWPGLLFLLLFHVVQGYFMLLLPPAYVLVGVGLHLRCRPRVAARVAAAVALLSAGQFLFYPWSPRSAGLKRLIDAKIAFQSAAGLRRIDRRGEIHRQGDTWPTAAHEKGGGR